MIESYRDLIVWQKSIELVKMIYKLTRKLPKEEMYGISDQLRRCVVSIPSNIAEGAGRYNTKEYIHFLRIARGSKNELETQLIICEQIEYLNKDDIAAPLQLSEEIGRMLNSLLTKLSDSQSSDL